MNRIAQRLDKLLALAAAVIAPLSALLLFLLLPDTAYKYIQIPALVFLASIFYLVFIRRRLSSSTTAPSLSGFQTKPSIYLILNILFVLLFTYSLTSVMLRPEPYVRPLGYFISTICLVVILAVEIVILPRSKIHTYFLLAKILLVALSLGLTPLLIYPELMGMDPLSHRPFAMQLVEGHIPEGYNYSRLPMYHLLTISTLQITGLSYKASVFASISFPLVLSFVFVFLLGRLLYNEKVGLMGALLLTIAPLSIDLAREPRPITLVVALVPIIIYVLLISKERRSVSLASLAILLSFVTILTHPYGSFVTILFLTLFWLGFEIFKKMYHTKFETPLRVSFNLLFWVGMLAWWMYALPFAMPWIGRLIESALTVDSPAWTPIALEAGYYAQRKGQYMLSQLGFFLYCAIGTVGIFSMLAREFRHKYRFALAVSVGMLAILIALFTLLNLTGLHLGRWYVILEVLLAIPAAVAVLLIVELFKSNRIKTLAVAGLILIVSFFSITCTWSNMDHPLYLKDLTARYSFIASEVAAANTIPEVYQGTVWTDLYYSCYLRDWRVSPDSEPLSTKDLNDNFVSGDYEDVEGLLVIRTEVLQNPFPLGGGAFQMDEEQKGKLEQQLTRCNLVYSSGSVRAFLQE